MFSAVTGPPVPLTASGRMFFRPSERLEEDDIDQWRRTQAEATLKPRRRQGWSLPQQQQLAANGERQLSLIVSNDRVQDINAETDAPSSRMRPRGFENHQSLDEQPGIETTRASNSPSQARSAGTIEERREHIASLKAQTKRDRSSGAVGSD